MTEEQKKLQPVCQVEYKIDRWPYKKKCTNLATNRIPLGVREVFLDNSPIEYICHEHTEALEEAYGEGLVQRLEYQVFGDSISLGDESD